VIGLPEFETLVMSAVATGVVLRHCRVLYFDRRRIDRNVVRTGRPERHIRIDVVEHFTLQTNDDPVQNGFGHLPMLRRWFVTGPSEGVHVKLDKFTVSASSAILDRCPHREHGSPATPCRHSHRLLRLTVTGIIARCARRTAIRSRKTIDMMINYSIILCARL
jgi:hypothetical protein